MRGWSPEEDEMLLQLIEVRFHDRLTLCHTCLRASSSYPPLAHDPMPCRLSIHCIPPDASAGVRKAVEIDSRGFGLSLIHI